MSKQIQPLRIVSDYFGTTETPVITEEFRPQRGWTRTNFRKRISRSWARKLRREGVEVVALTLDGRTADFNIKELTHA